MRYSLILTDNRLHNVRLSIAGSAAGKQLQTVVGVAERLFNLIVEKVLMYLSQAKKILLDNLVADLAAIDHVSAIVLGGSHATGWADESSDLDLGIYYRENSPLDTEQIKRVAEKHNAGKRLTATGLYEWGPWVNGGAWVNTASGEVDFVYRNIDQVKATIEKAKNGIPEYDYEQQPPFGFSSVIYLSETHYCVTLYDPFGEIEALKNEVRVYPPRLKKAIIQRSLWQAEFALWHAARFVQKQDLYNTTGCLSRTAKYLVDSLFALNELYPMGDKRAIDILKKTPVCPVRFEQQLENALSVSKESLAKNVAGMKELFEQTVLLTGGEYSPLFQLK